MNGAACWANRPEENPAGNVKCMAPFGMPPGRLPAAAGGYFFCPDPAGEHIVLSFQTLCYNGDAL